MKEEKFIKICAKSSKPTKDKCVACQCYVIDSGMVQDYDSEKFTGKQVKPPKGKIDLLCEECGKHVLEERARRREEGVVNIKDTLSSAARIDAGETFSTPKPNERVE